MKKVLIPTKLDAVACDILKAGGKYEVILDPAGDPVALARKHPDAYAVIVRSEKITKEVIDLLPNLKVVIRAGAGYDTIDTKYARKRGIDVMTTPGANANGVAEEVIGMMLADARHIVAADPSTRTGKWEKTKFMGREIAGKTIGIVGLGSIGRLVARRLSGFDAKLLGCDPVISNERAQEVGVELADMKTLFAKSDYITLHVPENEETRALVGADLLGRMKEGATLINTARAGIVDEAALREAKQKRKIRFLNDVYPKDAEGPKSVADIADLMLPHLGASTHEANANAARRAAEELLDFDNKGVTTYIVNRDIPEGLDAAYCQLANTLARLCRSFVGINTTPKLIETTFYGALQPFADWLLVPIVAGIWEEFDRSMDSRAARAYLKEMGIAYANREGDAAKIYGNSITVDLASEVDTGNLRRVSIRGTVTESLLMVSRINDFAKLYFEPVGHTVFVVYDDRPGVIGTIGLRLAAHGINIEDMRNSFDAKTGRSLAIMKVNQKTPDDVMAEIAAEVRASTAFSLQL